ncbi:hypothetical protein GC207_09110 [bacterium]|nr:hypothetical protein [bacterium]
MAATTRPIDDELHRNRRVMWSMLALILAVYGLAIGELAQRMRTRVRQQILNRDVEVLRAMVGAQFAEVANEVRAEVREPVDQWTVLLNASRARGVLATRLFETNGSCYATMPFDVSEGSLTPAEMARLMSSKPVTQFRPAVHRSEIFLTADETSGQEPALPLLEVTLPLQSKPGAEIVGIGQFILEGQSIAAEFADLDQSLITQAAVMFGLGGIILTAGVGWAFSRMQRKHRQLADRTRDLLRANEELARAARTAAVGSVTAHLIHGLKNPLSGLHQFVQGQSGSTERVENPLWQDAVDSTRRMQQMVAEVVRVLREEEQGVAYELSLAELSEILNQRMAGQFQPAGVFLKTDVSGDAQLDNRQANLVSLILGNLLQNALQASSRDSVVRLEMTGVHDQLTCRVIDQGPGLPDPVRQDLFVPCKSTREGGTGIGLAISKQLAAHLGAELRLENSSPEGTSFVLEIPLCQKVEKSPLDEPLVRP